MTVQGARFREAHRYAFFIVQDTPQMLAYQQWPGEFLL